MMLPLKFGDLLEMCAQNVKNFSPITWIIIALMKYYDRSKANLRLYWNNRKKWAEWVLMAVLHQFY